MIRSKQKVTYKTIGEVVELLNINNIKKKSISRKIDYKITEKIWSSMIKAYIDYEFRKFKKK